MNSEKLKGHWYPLCFSSEIQSEPVSRTLLGVGVVLVRINGTLASFVNRCPHRGVRLSRGKVVGGRLQCGYHGWSFDLEGKLQEVSGLSHCSNNVSLEKVHAKEVRGVVWVSLTGEHEWYDAFDTLGNGFTRKLVFKTLKGDFLHSIENFLDPTHTPFIHRGLLRMPGRQRMRIEQQSSENGFSTSYYLEEKQNGLVNRLFDRGVDNNVASFVMPGFATLEYKRGDKLQFRVAVFFVPVDVGKVNMLVEGALPSGWLPASIIFFLLRPFLELAFRQDKKIIEEQWKQQQSHGHRYQIAESDLVVDHLLHLLADKEKGVNKNLTLNL